MSFKFLQQLIVLGIAIAAVILYVQPKFIEIRSLQGEVAEYTEAVNRATEFNQLLNSLLNRINGLSRNEIAAIEDFLPTSVDAVAVARDVETIAQRSNMIVNTISIVESDEDEDEPVQAVQSGAYYIPAQAGDEASDETAQQSRLRATRVSASVTGRYSDFVTFLESLEANQYPLVVSSLSVGGSGEGVSAQTANDIFQYQVMVETYELRTAL